MKKIATLFGLLVVSFACQAQCFLSGFGALGQYYKTTGIPELDIKFNGAKAQIEHEFGVVTDLYIFADGNSPNAFATTSNRTYVDGTVAFGQNLLTSFLWRMDEGEYAVAGVMAHEFGHVLQMKKGCSLSTMQKELQADFLAGYFFGKKDYLSSGLENFARSLYERGDYAFWSPQHHGTPDQRVAAMMAGKEASDKTIAEAYRAGIAYVTGDSSDGNGKATTTTVTITYAGDRFNCNLFITINIGGRVFSPRGSSFSVSNVPLGQQNYSIRGNINCGVGGTCVAAGQGSVDVTENSTFGIGWQNVAVGQCGIVLSAQ